MPMRLPRLDGCWLTAACLVLLATGCQPEVIPVYSPRAELSELPQKHHKQIAAALDKYFGTPLHPRLMKVAEQQPEDSQEPALTDAVSRRHLLQGLQVYTRQCAGCHGTTGDGQGPAAKYLDPPPRDYRLGRFKFISTPRGSKPRRADLVRIIRRGAKGTSMPAFRWMSPEDLDAVVDYVILLSSRGELEYRLMKVAEAELAEEDDLDSAITTENLDLIAGMWNRSETQLVQPLTPEPLSDDSSIEAGAKAFVRLNCYKCHGADGRGNKTQDVGKDDWGRIAHAADLTTGTLHGGRRPIDIYRRIHSGINGTPMPAFSLPDTAHGETEAQRSQTIWHLVHFITSIVEARPLPHELIESEIKEQLKNLPASQTPAASATGG